MRCAIPFLAALAVPSLSAGLCIPAAAADVLDADEIVALTRETQAVVERLRGIEFKRPVDVRAVDPLTARGHFKTRMTKFIPEDQLRYDEKVYAQLGLLPHGTDLMETMLDLLDEQAWGYYDPDQGTFFVRGDLPRATAGVLIAHELTHALDDQHYGIDSLVERTKDDDDRAFAISAVAEGSATVVMSLFIVDQMQAGKLGMQALLDMQRQEAQKAGRLTEAAPFLQRSLLGPYLLGQAFLLRGNVMNIMSLVPGDIDRAFTDPPVSSEQLLHPDKYWKSGQIDLPRRVLLPNVSGLLGPGWKLVATGTLGELSLAVLTGLGPVNLASLGTAQPSEWTNAAATGWAGDLYHFYAHPDGRGATVALTAWDSPPEAEEFEINLKPAAGRSAYRKGDVVVLVTGAAAKQGATITRSIFDTLDTAAPAQ